MISQIPIDPLHRFPAVRTSDPEEFRHALLNVYGATGLTIPNPRGLRTRGNLLKLSDIALGFSACGARAVVSFGESDYARLQIGLTGYSSTTVGQTTTITDATQSCITSPGQAVTIDYGHGYEQLILRVKGDALTRKLTALLGARPHDAIEFEAALSTGSQAYQGFRNLMNFLARQLDDDSLALSPLILKELEQAVIVGFLSASQHSLSHLLAQDAKDTTPAHVRMAEEYIEATWDQPVTISKLAEVTGVSARTLFKAFDKTRGYSPMAFAKNVRLRRAHEKLRTPDDSTSVTAVAFACGFANLGHFARDYHRNFGERPSDTLARAKQARTNR